MWIHWKRLKKTDFHKNYRRTYKYVLTLRRDDIVTSLVTKHEQTSLSQSNMTAVVGEKCSWRLRWFVLSRLWVCSTRFGLSPFRVWLNWHVKPQIEPAMSTCLLLCSNAFAVLSTSDCMSVCLLDSRSDLKVRSLLGMSGKGERIFRNFFVLLDWISFIPWLGGPV